MIDQFLALKFSL